MKLEDLEFGVFKEIEPHMVEVIINEGIVFDVDKIQRIEDGLLAKYKGRYALLANRINSYSHTHESMVRVAQLKNLAGLGILVYADFARQAAIIHNLYQDNVGVFDDRAKAITWLRNVLEKGV